MKSSSSSIHAFFLALLLLHESVICALTESSADWNGGREWTIGQAVRTSSGTVVGHAAPKTVQVSEYLGIPYAKPPVGNLRFAAPQKVSGSGIVNASTFVSPFFCFTMVEY